MATTFKVSAPMAIFRTPYTTTSSVSFPFPPPTAVAGLIGAILGFDNGAAIRGTNAWYWKEMKGTQIAIQILEKVQFSRGAINFWNSKTGKLDERTQIKHIFLKNPKFRIFVQGELEEPLDRALAAGESHYTPYLGVAYAPAKLKHTGRHHPHPLEENLAIDSVLPVSQAIPAIDIRKTGPINQTLVPFQMDENRRLLHACNVLYRQEPGPIFLQESYASHGNEVDGQRICWFDLWE